MSEYPTSPETDPDYEHYYDQERAYNAYVQAEMEKAYAAYQEEAYAAYLAENTEGEER